MVIERYIPIWGGAENQLRQLIPHLIRAGYEVEVITRRWHKSLPSKDIVDVINVSRLGIPGSGRISTIFFVFALIWYLAKKIPHKKCIIHTHGGAAIGALCVLAVKIKGTAVIAKIATSGKISCLYSKTLGRLILLLFKKTDLIISMTSEIREELKRINVHQEKICCIPNGVDVTRFCPASPSQRQQWRCDRDLHHDAVIVLFSGRFVPRKGLDLLFKAWSKVVKTEHSTQLVLLGSGKDQPDSIEYDGRQFVIDNNIQNIVFEGEYLKPEDYLSIADIFVMPSRKEGMPNALLEAMSSGLAVVASNIGGITDLIENNVTGILFKPEDTEELSTKIIQLIQNKNLRVSLGKNAREEIQKKFTFHQVAEKYTQIYQKLNN